MPSAPRQRTALLIVSLLAAIVGCDRSPLNKPSEVTLPRSTVADRFVGNWYDDEGGELVYCIFRRPDGTVVLQVPPNDTWWSEFENLRFEGDVLLFDEYLYTPASDRYGEHPFSGVRCETTMTIDADDPNRIVHTIKTVDVPEGITGALVRRTPSAG